MKLALGYFILQFSLFSALRSNIYVNKLLNLSQLLNQGNLNYEEALTEENTLDKNYYQEWNDIKIISHEDVFIKTTILIYCV